MYITYCKEALRSQHRRSCSAIHSSCYGHRRRGFGSEQSESTVKIVWQVTYLNAKKMLHTLKDGDNSTLDHCDNIWRRVVDI